MFVKKWSDLNAEFTFIILLVVQKEKFTDWLRN